MKYNVIVRKTGEVVCENCTRTEALLCVKELIAIDKAEGTFESGFYAIVEVFESIFTRF